MNQDAIGFVFGTLGLQYNFGSKPSLVPKCMSAKMDIVLRENMGDITHPRNIFHFENNCSQQRPLLSCVPIRVQNSIMHHMHQLHPGGKKEN